MFFLYLLSAKKENLFTIPCNRLTTTRVFYFRIRDELTFKQNFEVFVLKGLQKFIEQSYNGQNPLKWDFRFLQENSTNYEILIEIR